jgi:CheY-like chemotaxis protein
MPSDSNPGPLKELATSRARFIAELGERLASIRHGLTRVVATPEASGELNAVRRRLHALAAAADVLHFTAAADALRRAELELTSLAGAPSAAPARERVTRVLDLVPSLALGAPVDVHEELDSERTRSPREPLCVLVFGDAALEAALHKPGPLHGAETHATRELDQLLTLVTRLGPDVLVLDGDDVRLVEFLPRLRQAAGSNPFPSVAVGSFESYEGLLRLIRRGVSRVLPKPVDAVALQRTLRVLVPRELPSPPRPNPFAHIGAEGLVEAIGTEARRAFVDPHSGAPPPLALGTEAGNHALAALWSAFARIRVLAARASEAGVRFPLEGPHGMIPLAPTLAEGKATNARDSPVSEALAGRRFVVADADPTLLGALSRALQRLGASVLPARDGAQALELCERQWPDALISDALLPSLDGFALCRRVRDDMALGDLPVAVICWKEHLLEHARRLSEQGAEARALDPDAFAPLAESLQKRMVLERRLERHDAVHGRIDGLTPRLLLQLACSRTPSARLSVRTGRLAVEVTVVDGRPVHARLLDGDSLAAEGAAALGPFLGMRVGRFSLEPLSISPAAHFSGDVMTVLAPVIGRARRARAWLTSSGAEGLTRIDLEPRVAALYAEEAPAAHRSLLTRVLRGESPRQLSELAEAVDTGDTSTLTALLLELVRRGGVLALIDPNGRDALDPDLTRASAPARGRATDAPAVVLPAALSLAEAVLQAVSAPDQAPDKPSARRTHPGLAPPSPPPEPFHSRKAKTPPLPDPRIASEARGSWLPSRPVSIPPEPRAVSPSEARASWVPPAPRLSSVPPEPETSAAPAERRASWPPPAPRSSSVPPEPRASSPSSEGRTSWPPPAPRSSSVPPEPRASSPSSEGRTSWLPPAPRSSSVPPEPRNSSIPSSPRASWLPPAPRSSSVPPEPRTSSLASEGRTSWLPSAPRSSSVPPEPRTSSIPMPARTSWLPPTPRSSSVPPAPRISAAPSEGRASWLPPAPRPSSIPPDPRSSIPPDPQTSSVSSEARTSAVPPAPRASSVPPAPKPASLSNAPTLPPKSRLSLEPRETPEAWSSEPDTDEETDPGPASSGEASHALDEEPTSTSRGRRRGVAAPVLVTLAAATLALVAMWAIMGGALERLGVAPSAGTVGNVAKLDLAEAGPAPSSSGLATFAATPLERRAVDVLDAGAAGEAASQAPGSNPNTPVDVKISTEPLAAAQRSKLFPGHGLLEIRTWEPQRIYVDGVFVGNYASRLIPLNAGSYRVRLLARERDIEQSVQIQAGRRTRLWARTASGE